MLLRHLAEAAAPSRFTYLPGTTILYEVSGPVIQRWSGRDLTAAWRSTWSTATREAARTEALGLVALIGRDVHRAIVSHEADRICQAFYLLGSRPWRLAGPGAPLGADPPDTAEDAEFLAISLDYADEAPSAGR
jgi:hypothetical protein